MIIGMNPMIRLESRKPDRTDAAELLSDVLQAEQAILFDHRGGVLRPQLTSYGVPPAEVGAKLRELADFADAYAQAMLPA
jgi:hypothetical protein